MSKQTVSDLAVKLAKVEAKVENIPRIEEKVDRILDHSEKRYATKEELSHVISRFESKDETHDEQIKSIKTFFEKENARQDKKIAWFESKLWRLTKDVAVLSALAGVAGKLFGWF